MIAFGGSAVAVQKLALDGKLDLDKVQIEGMLLDIIKTDLMPQQVSQNTPASAPVPNGPPQSSAPSVKDQWELALGAALDQWSKYLDQSERETSQKLPEVECRVIRLHDGRPVWNGEHGWVAITEQEALEKYRECIAQHGLSNPDRTAGKQSDSPATTPPPVAPTPPDPRYVALCVQTGLIKLSPDSWNMPDIGGKMVTFQNFIGAYILSVAKPSWLYGIGDQAYARFNPAATADPASFVFPIPPDQQATPGKCPTDYSVFRLWRKH
jgi:hypothetical protein